MLNVISIEARDLPDAWYQCVYSIINLAKAHKYVIDRGSFEGQKRLEFDYVTVHIKHPGTRPLLPDIPPGLGIPNPVADGYLEEYLPYLMTSEKKPAEDYTYGQYLESQIAEVIRMYKEDGHGTNQAYMTVGNPESLDLKDPPCVINGTEIVTLQGKIVAQNIKIGDTVLTHKGNWKKVVKVYKRFHKGLINILTTKSLKRTLGVTCEHPINIIPTSVCPYDKKNNMVCKSICKKQYSSYENYGKTCKKVYKTYKESWTPASDLNRLTYVKMPIIQGDEKYKEITADEFWIYGLWLAEGDYNKKDGLRFNLGNHAKGKYASFEINRLMENVYSLKGGNIDEIDNTIRQSFYSRVLYKDFFSMFGKYSRFKKIPFDFLFASTDKLRALLDGFICGDGHIRKTSKNAANSVEIYTTSENLKETLTEVILKLGYIPTIIKCYPKDGNINGRIIKSNGPGYSISYTIDRKKSVGAWNDTSFCYTPIIDNTLVQHCGYVYNYEVEDDNSYVANGFPLHNCLRGIDTRIRYGKLHFMIYFRSWDMWSGMPANLGAIQMLKEYMAQEIGVEDGEIIAASKGLHLYDYIWELAALRTNPK